MDLDGCWCQKGWSEYFSTWHNHLVCRECLKTEKNPVDSNCMNNRGLVDAEKKETDCLAKVAQIPTCYNQGMQNVIFKHTPALKKMGNGSRISNRVTISSAKNWKLGLCFTQPQPIWTKTVWNKTFTGLRSLDFSCKIQIELRIQCKQCENVGDECLYCGF